MTAMTRGGDHEAWLDENVPDWEGMGPEDLGPVVADHAQERDYPQVFEDTTHDHSQAPDLEDHLARGGRRGPGAGRGELTDEREAILEEAREMTEEMLAAGESDPEEGDEDDTAADGDADE